jgi:hypothetical protein
MIEVLQWILFIGANALVIYVATRKAENARRNSFKHFLPIGGAFKQVK